MRRNLPNPFHPTILHRHVFIQPPANRFIDQGLFEFLVFFDLLLQEVNFLVNEGGLAVEVGGDLGLFGNIGLEDRC